MAKFNHFLSENIGFSVLGHLVFLAIIVFLVDVVISNTERFIAPDRIQITMIDLSEVRVSGDETVLYNTNVPDKKDVIKDTENQQKPEQVATDTVKQNVEKPSLIDAEQQDKKSDDKSKEENSDKTPAPRKKTVVRVNRNVLSLDRTLTVSVVDALRVAMTRCWNVDTSRSDVAGIRAVAHLTMRQNGTVSDVWFESASRAESDPAFAYVLETIRDAINICQPLRMLPVNEYEKWKQIQLTFYPTTGSVM